MGTCNQLFVSFLAFPFFILLSLSLFVPGLTSLVTPSRSHRNEYTERRGDFLARGRLLRCTSRDFSLSLSPSFCRAMRHATAGYTLYFSAREPPFFSSVKAPSPDVPSDSCNRRGLFSAECFRLTISPRQRRGRRIGTTWRREIRGTIARRGNRPRDTTRCLE